MAEEHYACSQCGADLVYQPGATALTCPYCGNTQAIEAPEEDIREEDFHTALEAAARGEHVVQVRETRCGGCGAEIALAGHVHSDTCPYCGTQLTAPEETRQVIEPRSLLPFHVAREAARQLFHRWLDSRWFAPSALRHAKGREDALQGVYVPYWTYDCQAFTTYSGERGDDYWTTESYTTIVNGKSVRRTRQVRRTRWRHVSGAVHNAFDDVLVLASKSLPYRLAERLEPWDLRELTPFDPKYLQGFRTESYGIALEEGFGIATNRMRPEILATIRRDIGGDHQRIHHSDTDYRGITFKHLLLPVWISSYRHGGKLYHFMVNARTGEIQGARPYSWVKILLAALGALLAVGGALVAFRVLGH
ncbi:MAG: hypothetical protein JXR77_04480 [Lentisphaeria bacterium]|nr:hypothetical protein [Lentisphaeria bacterium]